MTSINIITHCWAGQLRQYATLLRCHLASLVNHPPERCTIKVNVCYSNTDAHTIDVLNDLIPRMPSVVEVEPVHLELENLFQRSIGRDRLLRSGTSDIYWLADCDYMFGEGCLDALADMDGTLPVLSYPDTWMINASHEIGDRFIAEVEAMPRGDLPQIEPLDFMPYRCKIAIGGMMILTPELAAEGFCHEHRLFPPAKPSEGWLQSKSDRGARLGWGRGKGIKIQIPEVYRLRHTKISYAKRETPASEDNSDWRKP